MINNKKFIGLDTILIVILALAFQFQFYEPGEVIRFLFFLFTLIVLFVSVFIDLKFLGNGQNDKYFHYLKLFVIATFIIFTVGTITITQISLRSKGVYVHDGAVEVEESIKFLLKGKNFYTENYYNTPLIQQAHLQTYDGIIENPAMTHFVYLPFMTIFSTSFYLLTQSVFHWYDQRIVYIIFFILSLFILYKIPKELENKRLLLIIFALNPFNYNFLAAGFNDIFVYFWVILTIYFLKNRRFLYSSVSLGLACVSKQMAWVLIPFYFFYLYYYFRNIYPAHNLKAILKDICSKNYPLLIIIILIIVPFLIWDGHSFIEDTILFWSGSVKNGAVISGYGLGFIVRMTGLVKSVTAYFPFWIFQLAICLPLFYWLMKWQKKDNKLSKMVVGYSLFIIVFWFLSRDFNRNYINYALMVLLVAYFFDKASVSQKA